MISYSRKQEAGRRKQEAGRKLAVMKKAILAPYITITISVILLLSDSSYADPRAQIVESTCGTQFEHNTTIFVQNFFTSMEKIRAQMRASGFGTASTGSGPDADYGLGQCYGDLSLNDCVLCHAGARTVLARCYPFNGVRVYLDGCFMRSENYSFFQEYIGPNDHAVCGNRTRQDLEFRVSTRRALSRAVLAAPNNNGYARVQMAVARKENDSAYVLANCWRTIKASACRACLDNASASILGCLPSSEGRALNTGCFMRYSDTDFLNPVSGRNTRGIVIGIVIAAISAAAILIIGGVVGVRKWKNKKIQKKRKGDAEKLVKALMERNLYFKYSTLEKATKCFDEANKIGQGGFGTVYKVFLRKTSATKTQLLLVQLTIKMKRGQE